VHLLDRLYNDIMTLRTKYTQWMDVMKRVGDDFTRPTMRRILHSPEVMKEILEFDGHKEEAIKSVVEMESVTRRALGKLNPNRQHRRREQQFRFRRHECFVLHRGHASVS
jgi:hypothetical protein